MIDQRWPEAERRVAERRVAEEKPNAGQPMCFHEPNFGVVVEGQFHKHCVLRHGMPSLSGPQILYGSEGTFTQSRDRVKYGAREACEPWCFTVRGGAPNFGVVVEGQFHKPLCFTTRDAVPPSPRHPVSLCTLRINSFES